MELSNKPVLQTQLAFQNAQLEKLQGAIQYTQVLLQQIAEIEHKQLIQQLWKKAISSTLQKIRHCKFIRSKMIFYSLQWDKQPAELKALLPQTPTDNDELQIIDEVDYGDINDSEPSPLNVVLPAPIVQQFPVLNVPSDFSAPSFTSHGLPSVMRQSFIQDMARLVKQLRQKAVNHALTSQSKHVDNPVEICTKFRHEMQKEYKAKYNSQYPFYIPQFNAKLRAATTDLAKFLLEFSQ